MPRLGSSLLHTSGLQFDSQARPAWSYLSQLLIQSREPCSPPRARTASCTCSTLTSCATRDLPARAARSVERRRPEHVSQARSRSSSSPPAARWTRCAGAVCERTWCATPAPLHIPRGVRHLTLAAVGGHRLAPQQRRASLRPRHLRQRAHRSAAGRWRPGCPGAARCGGPRTWKPALAHAQAAGLTDLTFFHASASALAASSRHSSRVRKRRECVFWAPG